MKDEHAERLRLEALALRHVLNLDLDERADAAALLAGATLHLVALSATLAKELGQSPGTGPEDVAAMLDLRPALRPDVEALDAAGLSDWASRGLDPQEARAAFDRVLADTAAIGDTRRRAATRELLDRADNAKTAQEREDLHTEAIGLLARPVRTTDNLEELWKEHAAIHGEPLAGPQDAVMLDPSRGEWARWMNANLGPRGGLEPGRTLIIGGAPGSGKTSLGALLAVDALAAGCPVLFWQLELGRGEALEHLVAQWPCCPDWWKNDFWARAKDRPLPSNWAHLLAVPRDPKPEAEDLVAAMDHMARKARRDRKAGDLAHACNGLALVDYAQLLTVRDRRPQAAGHEILSTAASRLAKAAADRGVALVLLSQLNKGERTEGRLGDTALAGADLARVAHCAVFIQKAKEDGTACKGTDSVGFIPGRGEARLLDWTKRRGAVHANGNRPMPTRQLWCNHRALHGGEDAAITYGGGA